VERIRVRYSGRVQGVGFRATALSLAQGYAVTGWVRNDPDGAVTLEAQGAGEDVREFLEAVRSRMGKLVGAADEAPIAVHEGEGSFDIRR
jgi:acylphosphatase